MSEKQTSQVHEQLGVSRDRVFTVRETDVKGAGAARSELRQSLHRQRNRRHGYRRCSERVETKSSAEKTCAIRVTSRVQYGAKCPYCRLLRENGGSILRGSNWQGPIRSRLQFEQQAHTSASMCSPSHARTLTSMWICIIVSKTYTPRATLSTSWWTCSW